jgi:hypothetical protein
MFHDMRIWTGASRPWSLLFGGEICGRGECVLRAASLHSHESLSGRLIEEDAKGHAENHGSADSASGFHPATTCPKNSGSGWLEAANDRPSKKPAAQL